MDLLTQDGGEINQKTGELQDGAFRDEGPGSWDTEEVEDEVKGPEQTEDSVLNADVTLAEPGLTTQMDNPKDFEEEPLDAEEDEEGEQTDQNPTPENTPQPNSRRVLSFNDFFKN